MNKLIPTSDRLFMAVCGPSCSGKTELNFKMLFVGTFSPELQTKNYFYQNYQPNFQLLEKKIEHTHLKNM